MTPEEFLIEMEAHVYKEVAKTANLFLGKNKTASLSTGLFLRLPIKVAIEQTTNPQPKLYKELKSFMPYFSAYTKMGTTTEVYFTFLYHTEKDLKAIMSHIHRHSTFLAFVYIHELQHIVRKHNTHSYHTMMLNIAGDIPNPHHIINIAEDHAINYSIADLIDVLTGHQSAKIKADYPAIEACGQYDARYHKEQMSDIEILKDLLASNKQPQAIQISGNMSSVEMDGKGTIQPSDDQNDGTTTDDTSDKCSTAQDDADTALSDLSEALQDILSSNTKGTATGELFEQQFGAIKVSTGWFKKIKASFKRQVYYKTHDYSTSWSNLNSTYRHIYKSPKKQFIDNKINIVLSIDHSGSMSTQDLQKLLYLIESESKRIASIKVLIHDYTITKVFEINDDFDIANSPEFNKALATRYSSGGTSHRCVFEHLQETVTDTSMLMYMSFSDNHSDIEECFRYFPVMRKLTNYWVCTENNPVQVPGTNITMV